MGHVNWLWDRKKKTLKVKTHGETLTDELVTEGELALDTGVKDKMQELFRFSVWMVRVGLYKMYLKYLPKLNHVWKGNWLYIIKIPWFVFWSKIKMECTL